MKLLQELIMLRESAEATSEDSPDIKAAKPSINKIAQLLFGRKAGAVVDAKRGKEPKFFGVAHSKSKVQDKKGKGIALTFDNSTDSGEFELNSLTPLKIVKDSDLDKEIRKLFKKHKVASKKKTNYLDVDGDLVLREIHLGKYPDEQAVKLVRDLAKLLRGEKPEDEEVEEPPKEEPPKEEKKAKA